MTKRAASLFVIVLAALGGVDAIAQQTTPPPMDMPMSPDSPQSATSPAADDAHSMHMTPEEMRNMPSAEHAVPASHEAHAPDLGLERAAASQQVTPPMMAGMDTDMNDEGLIHRVWIENLEGIHGTQNGGAWDAQAWFGGDFDKLWVKSEGAILRGKTQDSKVEALWAHAILPFWDTQLGVRHDFSGGPSREWAAFGVQGISPYWFDIELTGYVGEEGRTAVRLKTEYDLYLTQRLILKPEIEFNAYGKPDRERQIGAGLSDEQFELRLRYEFSRRFAPYVGYVYDRKFAGSAALARLAGDPAVDHRAVAGVDFFF
jgi:copper resistance protein B